ncbi:MAG TPA: MoxR family ATPase [Arachidicoccus soli]|uniref:MoxR family ATPase n=1 Tax=Arachidicoccus soli TaxID=2341117 RepID=A0A386HTC0_9BACT|nr:MoxR family ATPase [Arachidicoccus soli]AYD48909.1 MoxR family ATPase [Arachidicoccus soli]HEU0227654.1 MoxR family ATPase [Arachidicoccus soli]
MENTFIDINLNSNIEYIQKLICNIEKVIRGKRSQIQLIITALIAGGHVLMEDNPGTGKTVMAKTLAHSIHANANNELAVFKRIQFTPDLLPMDLIGTHIFNEERKDFIFKRGPLFCNVLLADEINRASPKVQSALLECMAENQITVGESTYPLEKLFFTIATQNPIEMEGTYPLPAAQLDRFFMKIHFGYVDEVTELSIYENYSSIQKNQEIVDPVLTVDEILLLQQTAQAIFIHPELVKAVRNIVVATRESDDIVLGASTRSGIAFLKCLKAFALVNKRDFVTEDDIQKLAHSVLDHRITYRNKEAKQKLLSLIVESEMSRLSKLNLSGK